MPRQSQLILARKMNVKSPQECSHRRMTKLKASSHKYEIDLNMKIFKNIKIVVIGANMCTAIIFQYYIDIQITVVTINQKLI